jgi:hypothetical protein
MKKLLHFPLVVILLLALTTPVYASVELEAKIGEEIDVTVKFRELNSTVYGLIKDEIENNETKILDTIRKNLETRNLTNFEYYWKPVYFNDAENAITVSFSLSGSDILNLTFSTDTMRRTFHVRTDWRKFELNLTNDFSLDFTEYFGKPLSDWNFSSEIYPTYYCDSDDTAPFDPVCYFILPREATEVHIADDMETIVFELPPALGESLLNSPFLILGTIVITIIISSLYRSVRKKKEQESAS